MHQQQRHRGGREPRNAGRLSESLRAHGAERLTRLVRQSADHRVVELRREERLLVTLLTVDLLHLALEVSRILRLHLDLQLDLGREPLVGAPARLELWRDGAQVVVSDLGALEQLESMYFALQGLTQLRNERAVQAIRPHQRLGQARHFALDGIALAGEELEARVLDESQFAAARRQAQIR